MLSDKGFSYSSIYSTIKKSFSKRTTKAWLARANAKAELVLFVRTCYKAHFTCLYSCLFLSLPRIGQLFYHWFFVWFLLERAAAYLSIYVIPLPANREFILSGDGEASLSKLLFLYSENGSTPSEGSCKAKKKKKKKKNVMTQDY